MEFFDTHCHIHEIEGSDEVAAKWHKNQVFDADVLVASAAGAGVAGLMIVGCSVEDSELATDFVARHPAAWASIGIHPHEARRYVGETSKLAVFESLADRPKVVAVGECGLDYFYSHSSREDQEAILRVQLRLAQKHDLPVIFHVREAFEDFWPIFDDYEGLRGVIHSFTADERVLEQILQRNLYVGLNGIMTFTTDESQLTAARRVPRERLLLETDAPFLTPAPLRGKVNKPENVVKTAEFLARLRDEPLADLAAASTHNARQLFKL